MASLGAVLEQYPNEVIVYVTDPRTGVQRRCKWPPTISEIVEASDQHAQHLRDMERFKNWGKGNATLQIEDRSVRPTLAEMKEKYGDNWGLKPQEPKAKPVPAPTWDQISEIYSSDPSRMARLMNITDDNHEASTPPTPQTHTRGWNERQKHARAESPQAKAKEPCISGAATRQPR